MCSEKVSVPTSMVSYYHQVYSHTVFSLTHSPTHVIPVNTSMVSSYHQVYPLTALRELVLPLTLPWCRTTTKCTLTLSSLSHTLTSIIPVNTPMVSYYHQVITLTLTHSHTLPSMSSHSLTALRECLFPLTLPWCRTTTKSSHTHTNPCAPTHSHLPCPHTLCSPHFISPHSHHQLILTHLPHSPTHHASITSSSLPITYHYQPPPIASSHSTQHS